MVRQIRTHLVFDGTAEEAMNFYVSLFPNSDVQEATYYSEGENKSELEQAMFTLDGFDAYIASCVLAN